MNNLNDFIRVCLIHPSAANQTFIVADGESVSTRQFTDAIAKGFNKELIQLPVPLFALKALGSLTGKSAQIEQVLGDLEVDTSKARRLLGWRPPENMEQAMRELSGENTA